MFCSSTAKLTCPLHPFMGLGEARHLARMGKRNGQARLTGPPIVALADSAQPVVLSPCHLARPGYIMQPGPPAPLSAIFALVCSANGKSLRAALGYPGTLGALARLP